MKSSQVAKYLIENNENLILASVSSNGSPWISPLGYAYDKDYNLYWVSSKHADHSENIRLNGDIAITIFGPVPPDDDVDGVYMEANAAELNENSEIEEALKVYRHLEQPERWVINSPQDLMGNAAWRMYKATPRKIYKRTDTTDPDSNQATSAREVVEL